MVFDLKGKVALITGGVSGLGLAYAKELLRNGAKGVTLADVNVDLGHTVMAEIDKEFGPKKTLFVKTDVTDIKQFENAFKKNIETFKHLDIVINNAGIFNDLLWEKEIAINVNGVINGIILALENYLPKYKQGSEAVIVNCSSVSAFEAYEPLPIYCGTKAAVAVMTRAWGKPFHYDRTKVRLLAVCPGYTETPIVNNASNNMLRNAYGKGLEQIMSSMPKQQPEHVAKQLMKLIQSASSGTLWVVEEGQRAYEYTYPSKDSMAK